MQTDIGDEIVPVVRNWWCPTCKHQKASDDLFIRECDVCKTQCEWREFPVPVFEPKTPE